MKLIMDERQYEERKLDRKKTQINEESVARTNKTVLERE
jgi:hypothetical protein